MLLRSTRRPTRIQFSTLFKALQGIEATEYKVLKVTAVLVAKVCWSWLNARFDQHNYFNNWSKWLSLQQLIPSQGHAQNKDIQFKVIHNTVKLQLSWLTEKSKESRLYLSKYLGSPGCGLNAAIIGCITAKVIATIPQNGCAPLS